MVEDVHLAHIAPGEVAGAANRDSVEAITSRVPLVLALIAVITFVLLFLMTGSVAIPLKASAIRGISVVPRRNRARLQ